MARVLTTLPGVTVIAQVADLSETYTAAESMRPDLTILAEHFTLVPEFDCMKALFGEIKSRWLALGEPALGRTGGKVSRSRIPMIDARMPASEISVMIDAILADDKWPGDDRRGAASTAGHRRKKKIVLIGASTGGVDALLAILREFPENCPPTAVVQHTGKGYSASLIGLLDRHCRANVVEAEDGMTLRSGVIVVAAGTSGHLRLAGGKSLRCIVTRGEPISGHVPSVDALFSSACPLGPNVVAALLTGMGRDGAAGMLDLRGAGCITIGQDEKTSVVYGMSHAAWDIGAVQMQLPLDKIGLALLRSCGHIPAAREGTR